MNNNLMNYFNEELLYLNNLSQKFSQEDINGSGVLNHEASDDPDIANLIKSFALLTARINRRLDQESPEISNTLMNVLYPHYLQPLPAMSIIKVNPGHLTTSHLIAKDTEITTRTSQGIEVNFRTIYPVYLWSLTISEIQYIENLNETSQLKINIKTNKKELSIKTLSPSFLRFYINMDFENACSLYQLIFSHTAAIFLNNPNTNAVCELSKKAISAVGYLKENGMLPYPPHSLLGFQLLTEFFIFPEKFLFFDLHFPENTLSNFENHLEICINFNRTNKVLKKFISNKSLALHCTPIINLFTCPAKPITVLQEKAEYHVTPNHSNSWKNTEVHSIENLIAHSNKQKNIKFSALYGNSTNDENNNHYWHETRKSTNEVIGEKCEGKELFINLISNIFSPTDATQWTLHLDLLCCNRDIPHLLAKKEQSRQLVLWKKADEHIQSMEIISRITHRTYFKQNIQWQLLTHLSLNHFTLCDEKLAIEYLKKIISLYDFSVEKLPTALIKSLMNLKSRIITLRHPQDKHLGLCQGQEITLEFNEKLFSQSQCYLFSTILSYFLSQSCSLNSFIQLILSSTQGEIARWNPFPGTHPPL